MKSRVVNKFKSFRQKAIWSLKEPGIKLSELLAIRGSRLLLFHGIDENNCTDYNTRFISRKKFEKIVILLKQYFNVISIQDYCQGLLSTERLNVVITFDDGYLNNLTHALPVLEKYQVAATFFISTVHLENKDILWSDLYDLSRDLLPAKIKIQENIFTRNFSGNYFNPSGIELKQFAKKQNKTFIDLLYECLGPFAGFKNKKKFDLWWKLLNIDQISKLAKNKLVTIGSHGKTHLSYTDISEGEIFQDMMESKKELEKITGNEMIHLAYPFSNYHMVSYRIAEKVGFRYQIVDAPVIRELENMPGICQRIGINPFISAKKQIQYIAKGGY